MRLLLTCEYDGTEFEGFQIQKRGRTVQGELEAALKQVTGEKIRVSGAGRTDAGVHALGQAAHFDTQWHRPIETLQRALNAVLPIDIAVPAIVRVPNEFSARFSAQSRTYRYTILNQTVRSPIEIRYVSLIKEPLDEILMNSAARELIGVHDFGAFGTPPKGEVTTRQMLRAGVERHGARVSIELQANAFLYRMVRRIVGTLVRVGNGAMSLGEFREVIARQRRAGPAVAPQGLCLIAINYDFSHCDSGGEFSE
jgi:tRNA pseudouridine38-40 synthase